MISHPVPNYIILLRFDISNRRNWEREKTVFLPLEEPVLFYLDFTKCLITLSIYEPIFRRFSGKVSGVGHKNSQKPSETYYPLGSYSKKIKFLILLLLLLFLFFLLLKFVVETKFLLFLNRLENVRMKYPLLFEIFVRFWGKQ
jgi:hypothetical protein